MNARVLRLNAKDNVLVALSDLCQGEETPFGGHTYRLKTDVPAKHKFATAEIEKNGAVVMFGVLIGKAMEPIAVGERVTTRNTHHEAAAFHEKTEQYQWRAPDVTKWKDREFLGCHREDGQGLPQNMVEATIMLETARTNPASVLRDAANFYKVDTDAIALKVKLEFTAKEKAIS